jgi:glycerate-2-kinase
MPIPVIKNIDELCTTPLRRDALAVLEAGYEAVLTERVIREEVEMKGDDICIRDRNICLSDYERIFFVGLGKCAVDASLVFEDMLGERITDGIVLDVKSGIFKKLRSFIGTHPHPSPANVTVTKEIVHMLEGVTDRDLVMVVISGGGSSLLCLPHELKCETLREITQALWSQGATIAEVNTVRKHLSDIQGGQLAKLVYPATVVAFLFSDVPGNDLSMIASGPTVRDKTTIEDAEHILATYNVLTKCKLPECDLVETPKEEKYFDHVLNILLVTNEKALQAMKEKAESLGYRAEIKNTSTEGFAAILGRRLAQEPMRPRSCHLYGGETTVRVLGDGVGGRDQEFALAAVSVIGEHRVLVAATSDGWDNTDVAGAICDSGDRERARTLGLSPESYLARNDSYHFWQKLGGAIVTGRTGINVSDFYFIMNGESA